MIASQPPVETWPLPALLRGARARFGAVIRHALDHAGHDDLPANGPYVIAAIARNSAPLSGIIQQLGVSKQTAGQLVDTLVLRGYLERSIDPADRRRLVVELTPRGEAAAGLIRAAVDHLEADLEARMGAERVRATRLVLASLVRPAAPDA